MTHKIIEEFDVLCKNNLISNDIKNKFNSIANVIIKYDVDYDFEIEFDGRLHLLFFAKVDYYKCAIVIISDNVKILYDDRSKDKSKIVSVNEDDDFSSMFDYLKGV